MIAVPIIERECLSMSLHTTLALQKKKKKHQHKKEPNKQPNHKKILHIKVPVQFLKAGPSLVQLWQRVMVPVL